MKVETKQVVKTTETTVYIADDGTEFRTRWECEKYEHEKVHKPLLDSLIQCDELKYYSNIDGQEYPEHHDYSWYFVRDLDDLAILEKVYPDSVDFDSKYIGKWICLETDDDCNGWVTTIDDGIRYATTVLTALGYKVEITKEAE